MTCGRSIPSCEHDKCSLDSAPTMAGTVGEEKVRVLTGADVCRVDVREPDSRLFESYLNRLPEVELEVAVMLI